MVRERRQLGLRAKIGGRMTKVTRGSQAWKNLNTDRKATLAAGLQKLGIDPPAEAPFGTLSQDETACIIDCETAHEEGFAYCHANSESEEEYMACCHAVEQSLLACIEGCYEPEVD